MLIFFTSRHYYFFETLKIVQKQLGKLNCSYGKVSHALNFRKNRTLGQKRYAILEPYNEDDFVEEFFFRGLSWLSV